MPQKVLVDDNVFFAGLWYYQVRALPIYPIQKEYGKKVAKLLRTLEIYARLKWKDPRMVQWDTHDFKKQMQRYGLNRVAKVYRGNFGLPVIIPRSHFFYDAFSSYPNLNSVYGDRGSGKTFFAWLTAWEVYKRNKDKFDEFQIYVYGDVDGLTKEIMKYHPDPDFRKKLIMMEDYEAPEPEQNIGKFIIYNELDEALMSGNALKKEAQAINMMIFRSRHYQYWLFYNVIRFKSILKVVRISSSFESIKPLSQNLLEEVVNEGFPKYFRSVILQAASDLSYKEALVSIPLYRADKMGLKNMGSRQTFINTPVDAPEWLINAAKHATKNYNVGSKAMQEKVKEMVEIAAEKFLEGTSLNRIVENMEVKYNFKMSYTWWRSQLRAYFLKKGYKFESLKEVQDHARMDRLSKEILG